MPTASFAQLAFTGGEWSQAMQGRADHPEYRKALKVCLNAVPYAEGSWTRRGGSRLLAATRNGNAGRVIAYDFRRTAPYDIEITDGYFRFFSGAALVTTNDDVAVSAISSATPCVVTTATQAWPSTCQVFFRNLSTNNPTLQGRVFTATVLSPTSLSLVDSITGTPIDGSTIGTFVSGTLARVREIQHLYNNGVWSSLRMVQADLPDRSGPPKVGAVFLHSSYQPYLLTVETQPTDSSFATFSFAAAQFKDGPYFDPVEGGTLASPSALIGVVTLALSFNAYDATRAYAIGDYVTSSSVNYKSLINANVGNTPASSPSAWVAVEAADAVGPNGFVGTDIGRMVRLYSEPAIWAAAATYSIGDVVAYGGSGTRYDGTSYWKSLANSNTGNVPGVDLTKWTLFPTGAKWTWGTITGLTNVIDRALSGSANIGDMTGNGGLAAAFDGQPAQIVANCAIKQQNGGDVPPQEFSFSAFVGKNYAGASDQRVQNAIVYPSSDQGFAFGSYFVAGTGSIAFDPLTILNLRGSATDPGSDPSAGTLLGTSGTIRNTTAPITIPSNDSTTAWKYLWIEKITMFATGGHAVTYSIVSVVSEVAFYSPAGTSTSSGVFVQILGDALLYTTPVRTWRLGLYSDTTGWPTCGAYHEGRLWLSGAVPNRIDSSKSNDPFNMAPTEPNGTVTPGNAISYTFNSKDLNPVFWLEPDDLGLVAGTLSGEWLVQATTANAPLTPTTVQAHRVTRNGCADVEPRRTELTLGIVQRYRRKTLEYFADVYRGKFTAYNLSQFGRHLMAPGVQEIAYQQELSPILWHRMADGTLVGITYKRNTLVSSEPPVLMAPHRHVLGSGRTVESIAVGGSVDGALDALTMVTNDPATGVRHVEKMATLWEEGNDLWDAWHLDDALVPTQTQVTSSGFVVYGLWLHEGKTVSVFAGGLDCGEFAVTDGKVTVPFGDGIEQGAAEGQFTAEWCSQFGQSVPTVVGFKYSSDGQIVRPIAPQETGSRTGPALAKRRRSHKYGVLFSECVTGSVRIGTDFSHLRPVRFVSDGSRPYKPTTLFSGVHWDKLDDVSGYDGMLAWRNNTAYPTTISAVEQTLQTEE